MRISRDALVAIALIIMLAALTVLGALQQNQDTQAPALASFSAAPNGAKALKLWLEGLGYRTAEAEKGSFQAPEQADFAFILEPVITFDQHEYDAIDAYVDAGGTLVAAGSGPAMWQLADHFDFELMQLFAPLDALQVQAPWGSPAYAAPTVSVRTTAFLSAGRSDFITHLAAEDEPVLVSFRQGRGRVFLCATATPFTNASLKDAAIAQVAANLMGFGEQKGAGTIWFDEWHHGVRPGEQRRIVGPVQWLRRTPIGHALLFSGALVFLALALQGRRFGRPTRLPHELVRRRPLEHITALANLSRRAGHRSEILRQVHRRLKRDLGSRYRLDPALPDAEWVAQLAQMRPDVDAEKLLALLKNLQRTTVTEGEMVRLAREAAEWVG